VAQNTSFLSKSTKKSSLAFEKITDLRLLGTFSRTPVAALALALSSSRGERLFW
jgi:hypothetical protein